jgi:hypothetical protein
LSRNARTDVAFLVAALAVVAPFLLEFAGRPGGAAGEEIRLYVGSLGKLLLLALAAFGALKSAVGFEADNPMRGTWRMMAAGLACFTAGEGVIVIYEAVLRLPTPYPSAADMFFVAAYPLFFGAMTRAIRAYRESGYPIGTGRERAVTGAIVGGVAVLVAFTLKPLLSASAASQAMVLNLAYPILDLAVFIPVVILLGIAFRFRGGEVWKVWAGLLAGFLLQSAGDVLFAHFTATGQEILNPLSEVMFLLSYAALARGAIGQYQLLRS